MAPIKSFIPNLPRRVWIVLGGDTVSALGGGMVLPFLIVYLHRVRDFPLGIAGLMVSTIAIVGLAGGPIAGWVVDRIGPRRALIIALVVSAAGSLSIAEIQETWHGFAVAALFGMGQMFMWPAIHSLLMSMVTEDQRSAVFSVHYATLNAGIGLGGVVGGLVADLSRPSTFEFLYRMDALTFLVFIGVLWVMKDVGNRVVADENDDSPKAGYREVLRDRVFVRMLALGSLLVVIGYSQLESGFPAFVTRPGAGISTTALGFAFAANTSVIVVAQLVVLKKLAGRRRTRAIAAMVGLWAGAWSIVLVSGNLGIRWVAVAGAIGAMAVFALGETFMSPTLPAIVNDLAPDRLRGRYNALYATSWAVGHIIGPAIAGAMLGARLGSAFFVALIAACGVAAYLAIGMERHLPEKANRVTASDVGGPAESLPEEKFSQPV